MSTAIVLESGAPQAARILIVDDNGAIHDDFRKVLSGGATTTDIDALEEELFGTRREAAPEGFDLTHAYQGAEAIAMARHAASTGNPFALAFVDVRMPPGMDGVETARGLWETDPALQIVICTAHSDYSWGGMVEKLGSPERWLVLKKPFDLIEVRQLAHSLTNKWELAVQNRATLETLEARVAERTRELARANVLLREEMVQREAARAALTQMQKLDALSGLISGIGHELNSPLCVVGCNLEFAEDELQILAEEDERLAPLARDVGVARAAVDRIAEIIREMHRFGYRSPTVQALDVQRAVKGALTLTAHEITRAGVLCEELTSVPHVVGPRDELEQAIISLIRNACQALEDRDPSEGEIRVATFEGWAGGAFITVSDNGVGIPDSDIVRVFDPFFTTRPPGSGLGLGLSVCQHIVTAMGGRLWIESIPGTGTTVTIELPAAPESATCSEQTRSILVIDAEPLTAEQVKRALPDARVVSATAERAENLAHAGTFDLALCESSTLDGATASLQRQLHEASFPVVRLGASRYEGDVVLPRPFTTTQFMSLAERLWGNR